MNQSNYNYQTYPYPHLHHHHHHQTSASSQPLQSPPFQSHSYPPPQWEQWDDYAQIMEFNRRQHQQQNFLTNVSYHPVQFSATTTPPVIYQSFAPLSSSPPLPQLSSLPIALSQPVNTTYPSALQLAATAPSFKPVSIKQSKSPELPEWTPILHSPSPPMQPASQSPTTPPESFDTQLSKTQKPIMIKSEPNLPSTASPSSPAPRPFVCEFTGCAKTFKRAEHLKRHIRSLHTKEKPYLCPEPSCGKAFSRSDNLAQHTKVHKNLPYMISKGQPIVLKPLQTDVVGGIDTSQH